MRIVGVQRHADEHAFDVNLGHGEDPEIVAYGQGFVLGPPLDSYRDPTGDLVVRWSVEEVDGQAAPLPQAPGRDPGLDLDDVVPVRRQRVAAYAVVESSSGLLATEYSDRTAVPGRWGMPGGGIDAAEQPTDAVLREVFEETAQAVTVGPLFAVQSAHWLGRSPDAAIQDFHAIRLVYRAECPEPRPAVVLDRDGTTASARWIPLEAWETVAWTYGWRTLLTALYG